jgi:hypothetical protein
LAKVNPQRAAKVGDFLCRYIRARHRFEGRVEYPLQPQELAVLIGQGKAEFDEIYIEPEANPPIVLDGKAEDFFTAIVEEELRRDTRLGPAGSCSMAASRS